VQPITSPVLSVIVPAWNEERYIGAFLDRVSQYLDSRALPWEIVVVDDGSGDRTASVVEQRVVEDSRVRLMKEPHAGKGAAIRAGMLAAHGDWRLMADTDLSVAPDSWQPFFEAMQASSADVVIASREAAGAQRVGEPLRRHLVGRVFNALVQVLVLPGINDTQCGFKLFRREAAVALFPRLTIDSFAFDVELLFLAQRAGFRIVEVGVVWVCRTDSRVRLRSGFRAFVDVVRVRVKALRGHYDPLPTTTAPPEARPTVSRPQP
jgi:glycosyltransferase involved in cell wall biosynthesis